MELCDRCGCPRVPACLCPQNEIVKTAVDALQRLSRRGCRSSRNLASLALARIKEIEDSANPDNLRHRGQRPLDGGDESMVHLLEESDDGGASAIPT